MKLAPPKNTLQPLPPNVQPAVSQNVRRTATPADLQTIQNVRTEQNVGQQESGLPVTAFVPASPADPIALWIAFAVAALVAAAAIWFWRSF